LSHSISWMPANQECKFLLTSKELILHMS
jgi:hypothetical protein